MTLKSSLSDKDKKFLKENYNTIKNSELRLKLGLTQYTFYKELKLLGLSKVPQKSWTEDEIDFLILNYARLTPSELEVHFGRAFTAIRKKASELGIRRESGFNQNEIDILKKNYLIKDKDELLELLPGHSWTSIYQTAHKLNLSKRKRWSKEEVNYLMLNYSTASKADILKHLNNRSWNSIVFKSNKIGLKRIKKVK